MDFHEGGSLMAWIESHQGLRDHPKTRRVARDLDVSIPTVVGHLHCLWHTVVDAAPDGDLSDWDAEDVAFAAMWEGDPKQFLDALVECGMGSGAGFLDRAPDSLVVHDWDDYAAPLQARKRASAKAHHVRWHESEGVVKDGCEFCAENASSSPTEGESDAESMPDASDRNATAMRPHANRNAPDLDLTEPNQTSTSPPDGDDPPEFPEEVHQLTRQLALAVKSNGFPIPKEGQKSRDSWLTEMDRLLRLGPPGGDGDPDLVPDVEEVAKVIDWATSDPFWKGNIQSAPKFREQWPKLRLRAIGDADDSAMDDPTRMVG